MKFKYGVDIAFMTVPFHERSLDSFSDDIIVRVEAAGDERRWRATLDVGLWRFNGDPEFAAIETSREMAIRSCAQAIRSDAAGIGKQAPHTLLLSGGYDFHHRLCRHWAVKEHLRDLGRDPNQFVLDVDACLEQGDRWRLKGGFLDWSRESRIFEAGFRLAVIDLQAALTSGVATGRAIEAFWQAMGIVKANLKRTQATKETWRLVDRRLAEALRNPDDRSTTADHATSVTDVGLLPTLCTTPAGSSAAGAGMSP